MEFLNLFLVVVISSPFLVVFDYLFDILFCWLFKYKYDGHRNFLKFVFGNRKDNYQDLEDKENNKGE